MDWLAQSWFFVLLLAAFIAMHMFGHGGHGGHSRRSPPRYPGIDGVRDWDPGAGRPSDRGAPSGYRHDGS